MNHITTFTLIPILTSTRLNADKVTVKYHEMVRIDDRNGYPSALIHVDALYSPVEGDEFYNALYKDGKTLKVRVTFEVID